MYTHKMLERIQTVSESAGQGGHMYTHTRCKKETRLYLGVYVCTVWIYKGCICKHVYKCKTACKSVSMCTSVRRHANRDQCAHNSVCVCDFNDGDHVYTCV